MCRSNVTAEAEHALAELLHDMAVALCPEAPESVVVGPVDFGCDGEQSDENAPAKWCEECRDPWKPLSTHPDQCQRCGNRTFVIV